MLHCLGYEHTNLGGDDPQCAMPGTDKQGRFALQLPSETAGLLGVRAANNLNYNLSVVTTGDDDPKDCEHRGFRATVNIGYIDLPDAVFMDPYIMCLIE